MSKLFLNRILIISLFLSNGVLLYMIFWNKPEHPEPRLPKELIIKTLHFDKNQVHAYNQSIEGHKNLIHRNQDEQLRLRKALYTSLGGSPDSVYLDSIRTRIIELYDEIEQKHLQHFLEIKEICHENQLTYYRDFTKMIPTLFFSPTHRGNNKPK